MRFPPILFLCALSVAVFFARPVSAEIIFDNTGMADDGDQFVQPLGTGSGWWATGFSTTATGFVLDTVTLMLENPDNGTQFAVQVYESTNNPSPTPTGVAVATLYNGTSNAFSKPFVLSSLGAVLLPSTNYFLAVEVYTNKLIWDFTDDEFFSWPVASKSNNVTGWEAEGTKYPNKMRISASAAVPEPSQVAAMMLLMLGVAARVGFLIRARRVAAKA